MDPIDNWKGKHAVTIIHVIRDVTPTTVNFIDYICNDV